MERELEYRMYVFVPYNISEIQKGIQALHCTLEYAHKYGHTPEFKEYMKHKTVILLNGGTTRDGKTFEEMGSLNQLEYALNSTTIPFSTFREPDLNNAMTAICFICDERVYDFEKYPDFEDTEIHVAFEGDDFNADAYMYAYSDWRTRFGGEENVVSRELIRDKKLA